MNSVRNISTAAWLIAGTALLAAAAPARAQLHFHEQHATACHPYDLTVKGLKYGSNGVFNILAKPLTVVCPIDRQYELPSGSYLVYVDGMLTEGGTVSCTLASYSQLGQYLGSQGNDSSAANFSILLVLQANQIPPESYQSVTCTLPTGGGLLGYFPEL
jgi:hypothetical protein